MANIETIYHEVKNQGDLQGSIVLSITGMPDKVKEYISESEFYVSAFQQPSPEDKEILDQLDQDYQKIVEGKKEAVLEKLKRKIDEIAELGENAVSDITNDNAWHDFICREFSTDNNDDDCCQKIDELHVDVGFKEIDVDKIREIILINRPKVTPSTGPSPALRAAGRRRCFGDTKHIHYSTSESSFVKAIVSPDQNCDVSIRLKRDGVGTTHCNDGGKGVAECIKKSGGKGRWKLRVTRNINGCFSLASRWRVSW